MPRIVQRSFSHIAWQGSEKPFLEVDVEALENDNTSCWGYYKPEAIFGVILMHFICAIER